MPLAPPRARPFLREHPRFRDGGDDPRAFLERCLSDLEAWEPTVGAFTALDREGARRAADAAAARWRAGRPLSLIDGMPVGIKDVIDTADLPTGHGSALYDGHRPRFDAASTWALREAGAVVLGKTVTTEFASSEPRGTRNPWDPSRTPGGSSSGSAAAVAYGAVTAAMGTQVLGSIVRPAGFCGVVGYKPGLGGINRGGSLDMLSQSCHGPLAASLEDAWAVARAVASRVGGDPGFPGVAGPDALPAARTPRHVGLLRTAGWDRAAFDARDALLAALERFRDAGVVVRTAEDWPELAQLERALADAAALSTRINAWEWRWPLGAFLERAERTDTPDAVSAAARSRASLAAGMTEAEYASLVERRAALRREHAALSGTCDALVTLTATGAAPVGLGSTGDPVFAAPGSVLGVPALGLPLLRSEGLPLGLQLLGFTGGDAALMAVARFADELLGPEAPPGG